MGDSTETTPLTADASEPQQQQQQPMKTGHVSFSIWPPTQRTRDAVIGRLVETLSSPSILSKRYGTMDLHVAADVANRIESEAFDACHVYGGDDGMDALQAYSKEISKRMLEAIKSRSDPNGNSNSNNDNGNKDNGADVADDGVKKEEEEEAEA